MCLIVVKPKGIELPEQKDLDQWFRDHPDGFGLAFAHQGKVQILKGAMTIEAMHGLIEQMKSALEPTSPKKVNLVLHFRQATHGALTPSNCHPFPLTSCQEALSALSVSTSSAVAHNGVVWFGTELGEDLLQGKTDTQRFIEDVLFGLGGAVWNASVQELIRLCAFGKFVLLTPKKIVYIGEFLYHAGCWFSNNSFTPSPKVSSEYLAELGMYAERKPLCDSCQAPAEVYWLEDEAALCADCFRLFTGREPSKNERALGLEQRAWWEGV